MCFKGEHTLSDAQKDITSLSCYIVLEKTMNILNRKRKRKVEKYCTYEGESWGSMYESTASQVMKKPVDLETE